MRIRGFWRRPVGLLIGVVATAAVVGGGVAVAALPTDDGVLTACVGPQGAVRLVDEEQDCKRNETRTAWNQTGPQGEQGPAGPQGLPGATGPEGPAGEGVTSYDDLDGLPCREGTSREGLIHVTYAGEIASTRCVPADLSLLTVELAGTGEGTVSSAPEGIVCGSDCARSYARGTTVTLTATSAPGSAFAGWDGACSGATETCTVTVDEARAVTATFDELATIRVFAGPIYTLADEYGAVAAGGGEVTGPDGFVCGPEQTCELAVPVGTEVSLRAHPYSGDRFESSFSRWYGPCEGPASEPVCTFTPAEGGPVELSASWNVFIRSVTGS